MGGWISKFVYRNLFSQQDTKLLMLGLDAAGKTTVLYKLKLGEICTTIPTVGFNIETLQYRNVNIIAWDVGGRDKLRSLWKPYFQNTQGVIFVIDSNDKDRLEEANQELKQLESEVKDAILLVLANKQDLPNALSTSEIASKLGLQNSTWKKWHIEGTCATRGDGLYEGLEWLSNNLAEDTWNKKNEAYKAQQQNQQVSG